MNVEPNVVPAPTPIPPPISAPAGAVGTTADAPLAPEHLRQLEQANTRALKIRKAAGVALFNGITIAVFAGGALFFGLISLLFGEIDVTGLVMGVGLGLVAYNEFRGRKLLRQFDRRAPRLLGWNQVGLMVLVLGYCGWMVGNAYLGPDPYPELRSIFGDIGHLYKLLSLAVYGAVAIGTILFQGLNAMYYFARGKHLKTYLNETPPWVVEVQRRTAGS